MTDDSIEIDLNNMEDFKKAIKLIAEKHKTSIEDSSKSIQETINLTQKFTSNFGKNFHSDCLEASIKKDITLFNSFPSIILSINLVIFEDFLNLRKIRGFDKISTLKVLKIMLISLTKNVYEKAEEIYE